MKNVYGKNATIKRKTNIQIDKKIKPNFYSFVETVEK